VRLKQRPGDFLVREDFHFTPAEKGEHHVHVLTKEKLDTLTALARVAHVAGIPRTAISFAGLKDRQGITEQWISLPNLKVQIDEPGLQVKYVGRSDQPVTSKQNQGNHFVIVVRGLTMGEAGRLRRNLPAVLKAGLPNYFDDQRFGCLKHGQGFIVAELLRGRAEKALRSLIATPSNEAEGGDVALKRMLSRHWGDWEACRDVARGPLFRPIFEHLIKRPRDFPGAIAKVTQRLKLIHLYAFQSFLWNRAVSRYLERFIPDRERVRLRTLAGEHQAWRYLPQDKPDLLLSAELPLVAHNTEFKDRLFRALTLGVLDEGGLSLPRLQGSEVAGMVFKEELRPLVLKPLDLRVGPLQTDEENAGRSKVKIEFALPRGAYATLVVKRLFAEPPRARSDGEWQTQQPQDRGPQDRGRQDRGARPVGRGFAPPRGRRSEGARERDRSERTPAPRPRPARPADPPRLPNPFRKKPRPKPTSEPPATTE
jgi:tRNA pseudouridine13 synthase